MSTHQQHKSTVSQLGHWPTCWQQRQLTEFCVMFSICMYYILQYCIHIASFWCCRKVWYMPLNTYLLTYLRALSYNTWTAGMCHFLWLSNLQGHSPITRLLKYSYPEKISTVTASWDRSVTADVLLLRRLTTEECNGIFSLWYSNSPYLAMFSILHRWAPCLHSCMGYGSLYLFLGDHL